MNKSENTNVCFINNKKQTKKEINRLFPKSKNFYIHLVKSSHLKFLFSLSIICWLYD
jgi:hypothetical protein